MKRVIRWLFEEPGPNIFPLLAIFIILCAVGASVIQAGQRHCISMPGIDLVHMGGDRYCLVSQESGKLCDTIIRNPCIGEGGQRMNILLDLIFLLLFIVLFIGFPLWFFLNIVFVWVIVSDVKQRSKEARE